MTSWIEVKWGMDGCYSFNDKNCLMSRKIEASGIVECLFKSSRGSNFLAIIPEILKVLEIFTISQRIRATKNVRYAYGSLLRALHRIQKIPPAHYPISYVKAQNIVKLKKPVISMTPVA
jgi:hypothetical protein